MKIAKIELFKVPPRWLFLKITTDDGIEGWGEPVVEGKASTVKAAVEEMASSTKRRSEKWPSWDMIGKIQFGEVKMEVVLNGS